MLRTFCIIIHRDFSCQNPQGPAEWDSLGMDGRGDGSSGCQRSWSGDISLLLQLHVSSVIKLPSCVLKDSVLSLFRKTQVATSPLPQACDTSARRMHSTLVRAQNVFGFFTTVAFCLAGLIALSVLISPQTPSASIDLRNVQV